MKAVSWTIAARAAAVHGPVSPDDRCFLLYEGASTAEVAAAAERAQLRMVSIAISRAPSPATDQGRGER